MEKASLAVTAATCRGGGAAHVYPLCWNFMGVFLLAVTDNKTKCVLFVLRVTLAPFFG